MEAIFWNDEYRHGETNAEHVLYMLREVLARYETIDEDVTLCHLGRYTVELRVTRSDVIDHVVS